MNDNNPNQPASPPIIGELVSQASSMTPMEVIDTIAPLPDGIAGQVLAKLQPALALKVLHQLPVERSSAIVADTDFPAGQQWTINNQYPEGGLGRLMNKVSGDFHPDDTVADAIETVREVAETAGITYGYVTDPNGRLKGVLVMRDLMLAAPEQRLEDVMIKETFSLDPDMPVTDAMREMVRRHYPVYPVCDGNGVLIGSIQGYILFEEYAFELSAQPGSMVGIEKEEHLSTPWLTSLKFRHPWLQLNLLTAFAAAFVVGLFEDTIARIVLLAVFLPVLAGQSGNTGSQSLAVTLRGMTLGEIKDGKIGAITRKEALLGVINGALVGVTAGIAMYVYALTTGSSSALALAVVVFLAMVASCTISGVTGVLVPVTLKRLGADPATASSIFLTTFTDVASMGLFLWLATVLVL
jgi:magnesium transporter